MAFGPRLEPVAACGPHSPWRFQPPVATHRNVEAAQALRQAGCWFLYLPPYSPDLNPIEQAFAKLKACLRKIGARNFTDLFEALGDICRMFTPEECWNYFRAARYVSD